MSGECIEVTLDKQDTLLDLLSYLADREQLPIWAIKLIAEGELLTNVRLLLGDILCMGSPIGPVSTDAVPNLDVSMVIQSSPPTEAIQQTKAFVRTTEQLLPNTPRYFRPRGVGATFPYSSALPVESSMFQKDSHTRASRKQRERRLRDVKRRRRGANVGRKVAPYNGPRVIEYASPAKTSSIKLASIFNYAGFLRQKEDDVFFIDLDWPSRDSGGLVHWALQKIRGPALVPVVARLLDARARVDQPNHVQQTLLHVACSLGRGALGKLLLERKANGNARCHAGRLPLEYAMKHCRERISDDVRVEDDREFMGLMCNLMDMAPLPTADPIKVARLKLCRATIRKLLLSRPVVRFERPRLNYEFERQLWRGWPLSFLSFEGALHGPGEEPPIVVEPAFAAARQISLAQLETQLSEYRRFPEDRWWRQSRQSHWSYSDSGSVYSYDAFFFPGSWCDCRCCQASRRRAGPSTLDRAFVEDYDEYKSRNLKWRDGCENHRGRTRVPFRTPRGGRHAFSAKLARKLPTITSSKARGPNWQESRRARIVAWSEEDVKDFAEDWWRE
eukprot:CAMPEP_0206486952 /NCGR_PEP_ID=MMETSP0324_2-20121206/41327_1 /ASSEMBLY_ACC=CAM_ASM_000836 /TAXON_ID=2866 /ORGANISM="Crypthecodinium cohnii, Strain Seligo" /LENGTH=559 /DNA_ID=CAMNT_0053965291 /DNA_START=203 /DNA_END=1882 /DNA_ORIENTATION=+